jgi:hypothetical protein
MKPVSRVYGQAFARKKNPYGEPQGFSRVIFALDIT